MRVASLSFALLLLAIPPASAQVAGRATVVDSDSFRIGGQLFRLDGIDAVEFHQFCFVDGGPWACGAAATRALQTLLDPFSVSCVPTGGTDGDAALAVCTTDEGDVAEIMVRQGWAIARSDVYRAVEETARVAERGIWRGVAADPAVFRAEMAAIEARYVERMLAGFPKDAEAVLLGEGAGIPIFTGFALVAGGTDDAVGFELRVAGLAEGFIEDAIPARGVFDWAVPAAALTVAKAEILAQIRMVAVTAIWTALGQRPGEVVEVADGQAYYEALTASAVPLVEAGRQPILLVAGAQIPEWVGGWFADAAPDGAEIVRKEGLDGTSYLGTIDGIDVYVGQIPDTDSYLLPADLLVAVSYGAGADGAAVTIDPAAPGDPAELVIRFEQSTEWLADPVVTIRYPYEPPAGPYGQPL